MTKKNKKKKDKVLIVYDYEYQAKVSFDLLVEIMSEKGNLVKTVSNSTEHKIETLNKTIDIKTFNENNLRGMRYDYVVNLSKASTGYIESMVRAN